MMINKYIFFHTFFPIILLLLNIIIQIFLIRFFKLRYLLSTIYAFVIGFIGLIIVEINFSSSEILTFSHKAINILNYLLLSFAYFVLITTGKTSLRVRILTEIKNSSYDGINKDEIYNKYNAKEITNIRLARLLRNKQIYLKNNKYYVKISITLVIAFLLDLAKLIFFNKEKCLYNGFNKKN